MRSPVIGAAVDYRLRSYSSLSAMLILKFWIFFQVSTVKLVVAEVFFHVCST